MANMPAENLVTCIDGARSEASLSTPVPVSGDQPEKDSAQSKSTFLYFFERGRILRQDHRQIAPVLNFQEASVMLDLHDTSVPKINVQVGQSSTMSGRMPMPDFFQILNGRLDMAVETLRIATTKA